MKLYYSPGACSFASHLILEEVGAKFEPVRINLREGEQRKPEYLKINPKGKVPALGLDNGQVLTENPVIMSYLADTHPQAGLLAPVGDLQRARAQEWLVWSASAIQPTFGPLFGVKRMGDTPEAKALYDKHAPDTQRMLDAFDHGLAGKSFVLGDKFSIADAYTIVFYNWAHYHKLNPGAAHKAAVAKLADRPSTQRALATEGGKLAL